MKSSLTNTMKKSLLTSAAAALLLASPVSADCTYQLFTITSAKGTTIAEFIDQLSEECALSVVVTDSQAEEILAKALNKTNLKNLTIEEVFDLILSENDLSYALENNILKISYVQTRTFNIDYIISQRRSSGSTDVTLSSESGTGGGGTSSSGEGVTDTSTNASGKSETGIKIESSDEVEFWSELDLELEKILNRPEDNYKASAPIINKNSGMVTVSATVKQLGRLEKYLEELQQKMQYQVLIDVNILSVTLNDGKSTGVDWSQLYALQNLQLTMDYISFKDVTQFTDGKITEAAPLGNFNTSHMFELQGTAGINEVVKFLKTQGEVKSVSNPKVLTLNNQPALITVGTEYFYKIEQVTQQQGSSGGVAATLQNTVVNSVFAGVLLDITPEIAHDGTITLKINPSISQTREQLTGSNADRLMPPDLDRRQMASVVTVKDGSQVILGGLINTRHYNDANQVPLLGDIPLLGYLFKYDSKVKEVEELVIMIKPRIIKKTGDNVSLTDLGYTGIAEENIATRSVDSSEEANEK